VCLGVPGTTILDLLPLAVLTAKASSSRFFAVLQKDVSHNTHIFPSIKEQLTLPVDVPSLFLSRLFSKTLHPFVADCHVRQNSFLSRSKTQIRAQLVKNVNEIRQILLDNNGLTEPIRVNCRNLSHVLF
jgi:hypothetical protein